jgi:hypothetical protein
LLRRIGEKLKEIAMARKRNEEYVNPAVPPYLTYDEQAFVAMYLFTDGNLSEIARQWPNRVTAEDCERLAADPRIKAECEYRMMLEDEVLQGKNVEPRPGHNPVLEIEHIANAYWPENAGDELPPGAEFTVRGIKTIVTTQWEKDKKT